MADNREELAEPGDARQLITMLTTMDVTTLKFDKLLKGRESEELGRALKLNKWLTQLEMDGNNLSSKGTKELTEALKYNTTLTSLTLDFNMIGEACGLISEMLKKNSTLVSLKLGSNRIDADGAEAIASALTQNTSLTSLSLPKNVIGKGALAIGLALESNRTLRALNLFSNRIGPKDMTAIAKALHSNTSLQRLNLTLNEMGRQAYGELAEALQNNSTLIELQIEQNAHMMQEDLEILSAAMRTNHTILELRFANNFTRRRDPGARKILNSVKRNQNTRKEDFYRALRSTTKVPWRRCKLMVVGGGRAGKSATVRSLLHLNFNSEWTSTIGIQLTETKTTRSGGIQKVDGSHLSFASEMANFFTVKKQEEEFEFKRRPSVVPVRRKTGFVSEIEDTVIVPTELPKIEQEIATDENLNTKYRYRRQMFMQAKEDIDCVRISVWDYGGQTVFHTLHHLFLTSHGVYLVVFNIQSLLREETKRLEDTAQDNINSEPDTIDQIRFWLESIQLHAPDAPVILVGTCADQLVDEAAQIEAEFVLQEEKIKLNIVPRRERSRVRSLRRKLSDGSTSTDLYYESNLDFSYFPISNKTKFGIAALREKICQVVKKQQFETQQVSVQWMRALDYLVQSEFNHIRFADLKAKVEEYGITSAEEIQTMLKLFHQLGSVLYFNSTFALSEIIVTNPQWLIEMFSKVIRDHQVHPFEQDKLTVAGLLEDSNDLLCNGLASRDLLEHIWGKDSADYLIDMMGRLMLLSKWKFYETQQTYFVPSMAMNKPIDVAVKKVDPVFQDIRYMYYIAPVEFQNDEKNAKKSQKERETGEEGVLDQPPVKFNFQFVFRFLPNGVFQRLVCLFLTYTEEKAAEEPRLGRNYAQIYRNDELVSLRHSPQQNAITCFLRNCTKPGRVLNALTAMLNKIKQDTMGGKFAWTSWVVHENEAITLKEARDRRIDTWTENDRVSSVKLDDATLSRFAGEL